MAEIRHGRYPISDLTKTSTAYLRPSPVAAGKVALNMFLNMFSAKGIC